ncbi:MAG: LamG domain-containing protein [Steroidobacteraceae bacterium]|nr:LamG domain-containing protein [Steroidobacteraceae bacterium]
MGACASGSAPDRESTVWTLRDVAKVAGQPTEVVGAPTVAGSGADTGFVFDGKADGVFVPVNPIEGWSAFTIEVRFKPDGTGGEEQRFLHIEDGLKRRVLLETRVTPDKQWAFDTFLFQDAEHKLTLLDRKLLHPTDRWYWVALVYDGRKMSHYIDGVLELEGEVAFAPMAAGRTSIGVRQNRVSWFKGAISESRFTPAALPPARLRKE